MGVAPGVVAIVAVATAAVEMETVAVATAGVAKVEWAARATVAVATVASGAGVVATCTRGHCTCRRACHRQSKSSHSLDPPWRESQILTAS